MSLQILSTAGKVMTGLQNVAHVQKLATAILMQPEKMLEESAETREQFRASIDSVKDWADDLNNHLLNIEQGASASVQSAQAQGE